jgi:hexosaminidase
VLDVKSPLESLSLHYTTDGTLPSLQSAALNEPLTIDKPVTIKLAAFTKGGRRGDVYTIQYDQQNYSPAQAVKEVNNGLQLSFYKGFFKNTQKIKADADTTLTVTDIVVPEEIGKGSFGLKYRGYIDVPQQGIYNFYFTCDDGGVLRIDDRLVVDNDGMHAPLQKSGGVALDKGPHRFELDFVEGGGGFTLDLKYSLPGDKPAAIPASWWKVVQ